MSDAPDTVLATPPGLMVGNTSAPLRRHMMPDLWSIVLAAGAGRRLASLTGGVPKQFWRPEGGLSLLDTTLARLAPLCRPSQTVVVVDRTHHQYVHSLSPDRVGALLFQPSDRGTATGVLMALMPVLDIDPEAVVVLSPCDHGVRDTALFRQGILNVAQRVKNRDEVVLFGAAPTSANGDYGWIVPGPGLNGPLLRPVRRFAEKPGPSEAGRLLGLGAVWNTMVLVARASTLRGLFAEHLTELALVFEAALRLAPQDRGTFLSGAYPTMRSWDFSRDLLTPAQGLQVYTWPYALGWSDIGTPERLASWFRRPALEHPRQAISAA